MDLAAWIDSRERAALARVRLAGLCLAAALLALAAWLGFREARLAPLPGYAREAVRAEYAIEERLRLKSLSSAIYLAKVRRNSLLKDITGDFGLSAPCSKLDDMRGLAPASPCAAAWDAALARIWKAAHGPDAPPVPEALKRDRWGAPYLLDQSEASCGLFGVWCPPDVVSSAGPDGKPNTDDDIQETIPQHLGPSRIQTP
ncbi:hypothetical protein [Fundidesulfovibrio terrae]|uniref:hypothetical protein n=1 Tax=Fundidesulfovibrio terrae TaxID=2922866 RepID=UPI001FAE9AD6|nr:hypothetical protein [Fundidesulfovibrio terrae]